MLPSETNRTPKVSVVIPAYNAEKFIEEAVNSVLHQTFKDWELFVIDDGSVDRTSQIVETFTQTDSRIHLVTCANGGVCRARDRGADLASAEYILFLDADDFLEPSCLDILVPELDLQTTAVGVYGLPKVIDGAGKTICDDVNEAFGANRYKIEGTKCVKVAQDEPTTLATMAIWTSIFTPGQVLLRKSSFDKAGRHYAEIPNSEDWDLWLRLCVIGNFAYIPRFVMTKRELAQSRSREWATMALAEPMIRGRLANSIPMSNEDRRVLRTAHRYSCLVKLGWVKGRAKEFGAIEGIKQILRAGKSYLCYLNTRYEFQ